MYAPVSASLNILLLAVIFPCPSFGLQQSHVKHFVTNTPTQNVFSPVRSVWSIHCSTSAMLGPFLLSLASAVHVLNTLSSFSAFILSVPLVETDSLLPSSPSLLLLSRPPSLTAGPLGTLLSRFSSLPSFLFCLLPFSVASLPLAGRLLFFFLVGCLRCLSVFCGSLALAVPLCLFSPLLPLLLLSPPSPPRRLLVCFSARLRQRL